MKKLLAIILASLSLSGCAFFTVDQTELANVRRFGTAQYKEPLGPGFHFKMPLIDSADTLQVTLTTLHIPPFDVLTVDNQRVTIEENFNFTIPPGSVNHVLYEIGASGPHISDQIIPVVRDRTARVLARQNMVTVNANREAIQAEIEKEVVKAVTSLFQLEPHSFQITAINPSPSFMKSIDEATMAKNAAIAAENTLRVRQFEAQQKVALAKGEADSAIEQARGQAESTRLTAQAGAFMIKLKGDAEAAAITARGEALQKNPNLVGLVQAERWDGKLPATMVPGGTVPFITLPTPK